jgi:pentose-5-phosphate-3-epimerase
MILTPEQQACSLNTSSKQLHALAEQSKKLARLVCTNPNAAPDLLQKLANSCDDKILLAIASNPNTPTNILWKVGVEFPEEVLSNPVFSLLLLENANLIEEIPQKTLESFLKVDIVPDSFIKWVVNTKKQNDLALAVTMNPKSSKEILEQLINHEDMIFVCEDSYQHVIDSAQLHINWSNEIDDNWQDTVSSMIQNTRWYCIQQDITAYRIGLIPESLFIKFGRHVFTNLINQYTVTERILKQIVEKTYLESFKTGVSHLTLNALAANPNTPLNFLEEILGESTTGYWATYLCEKLISNPSISLNTIQEFYCSERAIKTLNTSSETLRKLAKSKWIHIRRGVAYHHNTPIDILSELAEEVDEMLYIALAVNSNTTANILNKIILRIPDNNKYLSIIEAVICNPNTDEETLKIILNDNDCDHLLKLIAYHPNVTENLIQKLASIDSDAVLTAVAASSKTPASILAKLANCQNDSIRVAVAGNSNTPKEILSVLKTCNNKIFSKKAIKNHKKQLFKAVNPQIRVDKIALQAGFGFVVKEDNPQALLKLAQETDKSIKQQAITDLYQLILIDSSIPTQLLEQAAKIQNLGLQAAIIRHPNTSLKILRQFAKHSQVNIRLLIIKNPKTTVDILKAFLEDKHQLVKESAFIIYQQLQSEDRDINLDKQLQIVQNLNTLSDVLDEISTSQWLIIREQVALHPNTSVSTLIKLAEDNVKHVQLAVTQNLNTPDEILEKLATRHKQNTDIHITAVKNLILRDSKQASKFISRYIKNSKCCWSRFFALLNPLAPVHLLVKNYRSSYWLERYAIAQNPNTPRYIVQSLTQDANRIVRAVTQPTGTLTEQY